jgi:hypothetical protein
MSNNISLDAYVSILLQVVETSAIALDANKTSVVLQTNYDTAVAKHKLGVKAQELAKIVGTNQIKVDQANLLAAQANTIAKAEKVILQTALALYTTSPTDANKIAKETASAKYDMKLQESVESAARAATASNILSVAITNANQKALEAGYMYPIAMPSDQQILETLTQLITEGCIDVSEIQQKITEIVATSNTFNVFIEKMSVFNDYEAILEIRLKQIFNFLTEDGVIDSQEAIITSLRYEIINAINIYKKSVVSNNALATQVNSLYNNIGERLSNLHLISTEVSTTMSDVEKLIQLKRGGQTFAKKIVFVSILPQSYTPNSTISLVVANMKLLATSTYQMRYNFVYDDINKIITWIGNESGQSTLPETIGIDVKLEVMSTNYSAYDTTSSCTIILRSPANQIREKTISCVASTGRIVINKNEKIQFIFKQSPISPLQINQGMVTFCLC